MTELKLKNFAKIEDTHLNLNDITVLAGKPGSGKSYIMKFYYAYIEALSTIVTNTYGLHYAFMDNDELVQPVLQLVKSQLSHYGVNNNDEINQCINTNDYIKALELLNINFKSKNKKNDKLEPQLFNMFKNVLTGLAEKQKRSLVDSEIEKFNFIFRNVLESIFGSIEQISDNFVVTEDKTTISYVKSNLIVDNLIFNNGIKGAIFVETPLILEFQNFLPAERFKAPYHIDSLLQELNKNDFSFTSDDTSKFINEFRISTSKIINGNIAKGAHGFSFESSSGKNYNIVNASSGIKSIGLLQYLVTNKALKKGSTLFWEEPEVHLHPTWQLKMVDLFIELMNAGVKIVFSTHSPFMADYLNAKAQREKFLDRVSFNLLCEKEEIVSNTVLNDQNWNLLQDELMGAFEDIMWQYL